MWAGKREEKKKKSQKVPQSYSNCSLAFATSFACPAGLASNTCSDGHVRRTQAAETSVAQEGKTPWRIDCFVLQSPWRGSEIRNPNYEEKKIKEILVLYGKEVKKI